MSAVSLKDVSEIHTDQFWYGDVSNVEIVYLSGNSFLRFTYLSGSCVLSNTRKTACVALDAVIIFEYHSIDPELKTQAEVLQAYKDGRLVGY